MNADFIQENQIAYCLRGEMRCRRRAFQILGCNINGISHELHHGRAWTPGAMGRKYADKIYLTKHGHCKPLIICLQYMLGNPGLIYSHFSFE